jgi:hypothetical protein
MLGDDHAPALHSFQDGEERFVWGRHSQSDELWKLEEGQAHEQRSFVNANIVCPVPGCPTPKLTTVARHGHRHGLRHFESHGGHGPESFAHSQGCALVESWLKGKFPRAIVKREEYSNEAGDRRADVMMTNPVTGRRVAFEIQYSPITVDEWTRRHDSYRSQGITDVWLFGHTSKQMKITSSGKLKLSPTHEAVIQSGSPLFYINPFYETSGGQVGLLGVATCALELEGYSDETNLFSAGSHLMTTRCYDGAPHMRVEPVFFECPVVRVDGLRGPVLDKILYNDELFAARDRQDMEDEDARREENLRAYRSWVGERSALIVEIRTKLRTINSKNLSSYSTRRETVSSSVRTSWVELNDTAMSLVNLISGYQWRAEQAANLARIESQPWLFGPFAKNVGGNFEDYYWQAVVWFNHIAGSHSEEVDTKKSSGTVRSYGSDETFGDSLRRLRTLQRGGYLVEVGSGKYPTFRTAPDAQWW